MCVFLAGPVARADFILTPVCPDDHWGDPDWLLMPDDLFHVDCLVTSDSGDELTSAIFRVEFFSPGLLRYDAYSWTSPFTNDTTWDDSKPGQGELPVILDEETLFGDGYPDDVVDIELSNVKQPGAGAAFTSGLLVTLTLSVPSGYVDGQQPIVRLVPEQFYSGHREIPTTAGPPLRIPEPGCLGLLALGATCLLYRRWARPAPVATASPVLARTQARSSVADNERNTPEG